MSLTLDFILLFVLVIIPGLLFKRFYFYGEFSKQFTTKDSVYKSIFYSIIPGILIQLSCFALYGWIFRPGFKNEEIFSILQYLVSKGASGRSQLTNTFLNDHLGHFLCYELGVSAIAILLGGLLARFIRFFKLDIKYKLFRFRNQWFYLFSGEINSFRKFKKAKNVLDPYTEELNSFSYYPPHVDLLVGNESRSDLYSGYVIDYDLKYENPTELDNLYLLRASRYRSLREGEDPDQLEMRGSRVLVPIPGNTFVINAKDLMNLNITYVPMPDGLEISWRFTLTKWLFYIFSLLNTAVLLYFLLIPLPVIRDVFPKLSSYFESHNVLSRAFAALIVTQAIALLMPSQIKDSKEKGSYKYSGKYLIGKILVLALMILIYYIIYY